MGDWIEHDGIAQPVSDEVMVEAELRNGTKGIDSAMYWSWDHVHTDADSDIVKYRVVT
jgi:hypothetical protein